jgi:hypothetical protein
MLMVENAKLLNTLTTGNHYLVGDPQVAFSVSNNRQHVSDNREYVSDSRQHVPALRAFVKQYGNLRADVDGGECEASSVESTHSPQMIL